MLDNARKYLTVLNSAGEHGTALDSAIEHDIDTMGTITYYNFSDVTMSHYGKFLSLLMRIVGSCQSIYHKRCSTIKRLVHYLGFKFLVDSLTTFLHFK